MHESSLVIAKITQLLKDKINGINSCNTRDMPLVLFLK